MFICEGSKIIKTLHGHDNYVQKICFFSYYDFVSVSSDHQTFIWNQDDLTLKHKIQNNSIQRALEILDEELFVTGDWNRNLNFWRKNGKLEREIILKSMGTIDTIRVLKKSKLYMEDFFYKCRDFNIYFNFKEF